MTSRLLFFMLLLALAVVVSACAPAPELRNENFLDDTSFVTGEPCGPPCWRGITVGETTWADALTIIEDDDTLVDLEERAADDSSILGAIWGQADGDGCCQMYSEDGEIVDVLILQTAPQATLGEVVEIHGEPAYLIGETLTDDQGVFSLFYPDLNMLIYTFVEGESGSLGPENEIIGFGYFSPDRMDLLLLTNDLHEWEGYQSYAAYMDSPFEVTPSVTLTPQPEDS